ncbi:hypothetical protein C7448_103235 [Tenacibaculum gallaicum]|uniref:PEGA domain-containing protein n=1 Tax=Tenacibaculum gallaicum TaxID=561505 RepID=A0A3E0I1S4_9FLAO|nr:hypothetical protein [Tenacibaculum gallaicum]REH52500.1 hypothetical protein C7448_103235 [Tenacibaculum gallaicum]
MGKIKIESTVGAKIYVNEKELGLIKREDKEYELDNGEYEIYAKASWCGSQKININVTNDKTVTLTLNSFKYEGIIKAIMMVFVALFMFSKSLIFLILAGIIILYPLYYISFGKDNYLELNEKNENSLANTNNI